MGGARLGTRDADANKTLGITAQRSKRIRAWILDRMEYVGYTWRTKVGSREGQLNEEEMVDRVIEEFGGEFKCSDNSKRREAIEVLFDMALHAYTDCPKHDLGLTDLGVEGTPIGEQDTTALYSSYVHPPVRTTYTNGVSLQFANTLATSGTQDITITVAREVPELSSNPTVPCLEGNRVSLVLTNAAGPHGFNFPIRMGYFEIFLLVFREVLGFDRSREEVVCNGWDGEVVRLSDPERLEGTIRGLYERAGCLELFLRVRRVEG